MGPPDLTLFQRVIAYLKQNSRYTLGVTLALLITYLRLRVRYSYSTGSVNNGDLASYNNLNPTMANVDVKMKVPKPTRMPFWEFLRKIESQELSKVFLKPSTLEFQLKPSAGNGADSVSEMFFTRPTRYHPGIVELLHNKKVPFEEVENLIVDNGGSGSTLKTFMAVIFPFVYLGVVVYVFRKYMRPDSDDSSSTAKKSRQKSVEKMVTFKDVAGCDKAKALVYELTDFFRNPDKYERTGARVPRGVLLVGPPGTGKTLLAKALANEMGLPFYFCSGSDFVEVYAGRGASRIRKLFETAKKNAPCVLFFDEIDALGKKRSTGEFVSNDERDQTLNQLLTCMDGFDNSSTDAMTDDATGKQIQNKTVIVIAATNRYETLDNALTRPGRFDRIIPVELPDARGRQQIYRVHSRKMKLHEVDFATLATLSERFSGADISHVCNEAAINAVRNGRDVVLMEDFLAALHEFQQSRRINRDQSHSNNQFNNNPAGLINQLFTTM